MKAFWKSKVLLVNVVALGLHFAKLYIGVTSVPDVDPQGLAIANIVLRLITHKGLSRS